METVLNIVSAASSSASVAIAIAVALAAFCLMHIVPRITKTIRESKLRNEAIRLKKEIDNEIAIGHAFTPYVDGLRSHLEAVNHDLYGE